MTTTRVPFVSLELVAKRALASRMRAHLRLASQVHGLLEAAIGATKGLELGQADQVKARLLVQASLQLRCISLVSERGYGLQAAGMSATLYELAAAVAFIGTSEEKAARWLAHDQDRQSYPPPKDRAKAVRALLASANLPSTQIEHDLENFERSYGMFCMAKHGNPIVLRNHGLQLSTTGMRLFHGPVGDTRSVQLAQYSIAIGSIMVVGATNIFMLPYAEQAGPRRVKSYLRAATRCLQTLGDMAPSPND